MPIKLPDHIEEARLLSQDSDLVDCLFLVKNGVPFDVAFSLEASERLAWIVIFGQFGGLSYNWETGQWDKPR